MSLPNGSLIRVANIPISGVGVIQGTGAGNLLGALGTNNNTQLVLTAGSEGGRVISLQGFTNDTVTINCWVQIRRGAQIIPKGLVNIPLSSGNTNAARFAVDFLNGINIPGLPIDNTGRQYIALQPNDELIISTLAGLSNGTFLWVVADGANYQAI